MVAETVAKPPYYLLDTNILVASIRAGKLGTYVENTFHLKDSGYKPLISVVSVGEALSLAKKFDWGEKKLVSLDKLLKEIVWVDINTTEILEAYAELDRFSESKGLRMGKNDLWISATVKATGATLLTTDNDFGHLMKCHIRCILIDQSNI